jgi:hypothetical protein
MPYSRDVGIFGRNQGINRRDAGRAEPSRLTHCMVRPCGARRFWRVAVSGLASMYQTSVWSMVLRAIMDISARASSLAEKPQRAKWVTSVRMRREDRTSISSRPLADLGR